MSRREGIDLALFEAVRDGDLAGVRAALSAGANANAVNEHQLTPLLEASGQGSLEIVRLLIEHGAVIDYTGMSEGSPLMLAAFMGQLELLDLFLAQGANASLAMPHSGETALHMAAVTGHTAAVQRLLAAGADPNLPAKVGVVTSLFDGGVKLWGETPLHFAAAYGDEQMIRALIVSGAERTSQNAQGETPLQYAGRHRRERGVRDLLT